MFAFKWFMIVDDSWWNHTLRLHNSKQVFCSLRSAILVAFEILIKKLQVEDTGAYQEMIRMNYKTFCEILVATLVILPFAILVWALFQQNCWQKNYRSPSSTCSNSKKLSLTIMLNLNMFKLHNSQWYCMKLGFKLTIKIKLSSSIMTIWIGL